ncbi:MAG: potassium-transporting ATPase subunit KdpA [Polyangiaceae bacterium]
MTDAFYVGFLISLFGLSGLFIRARTSLGMYKLFIGAIAIALIVYLFVNAHGAHPYENPTAVANFIEMLSIAVLPAGLTHTFGRMVKRPRAGGALLGVMTVLFATGLALCHLAEYAGGNPGIAALSVAGGNLEGKEVRFGVGASVLDAVVTSNGACGAYKSLHGSYMPLGVMIPLINMLLGELTFGGLGTGLYSILMVALIGFFLAGLMVGRTPEYLGKKIGAPEIKVIMIYTLMVPLVILFLTALAIRTDAGLAGLTTNSSAQGFTENDWPSACAGGRRRAPIDREW